MKEKGERKGMRSMIARHGFMGLIMLVSIMGAVLLENAAASVPPDQRGTLDAERSGTHDAANIRTIFWNYGMVGDYPPDPGNVDLSVFHSVEFPKGSGMNYSDGVTPFVLAKVRLRDGTTSYIMETGFRERQANSPSHYRVMRFEPRPGFFEPSPILNPARSPAISNDPRTWPSVWPDKLNDPDDPGWPGKWNGYFGKRAAADQESFTVMDDDYYDAWDFYPDSTDHTRHGLGLRVEVRGFQWSNPQAGNVIFWHYDITNEGTTDYDDNVIFGLYMDSGVGGSALSCDQIYESDDDNAYFDRTFDQNVINLVYTWDKNGHGNDLSGNCGKTGYLGYAYLETPGNSTDGIDNDQDGITDEKRDGGPGQLIVGKDEISAYVTSHYNLSRFQIEYGPLEKRPAYKAARWWTGDEDMDWVAELHDVGADGIPDTHDTGEGDGIPTEGEPNFDKTDLHESDQIGLTGFKLNRIKAGLGNPNPEVDNVLFYETTETKWGPQALYEMFTNPDPSQRFDPPLAANYNIAFLFASGPFQLMAGKSERFSLALAAGADLDELRRTVRTVQSIYNANYQFAIPPPTPTLTAESGDRYVRLSWDDKAERGTDPVSLTNDFEGYRIYRSTDPEFQDPRVITNGNGTGPIGNGKPIAQFDLIDGKRGFSDLTWEGTAYYLGNETGIVHTWADSSVVNGQQYYYAICSYDYGSDSLGFYPSESPISVSHTPRGGVVMPINVVAVRPEPKVIGYVGAETDSVTHIAGAGLGSVHVRIVNSNLVPDDHIFKISFTTSSPESIRATAYTLSDSTTGEVFFRTGRDLDGVGTGPVGSGILPIVSVAKTISIDSAGTGFDPGSPTNIHLGISYLNSLPIEQARPGFPDNLTIEFSDTVVDTSVETGVFLALPAKFRVFAHTDAGDLQMRFRFRDNDNDGTLSQAGELFDVLTYLPSDSTRPHATWRAQVDTTGTHGVIIPPTRGDVFQLRLKRPIGIKDVFAFRTQGQRVDEGAGGGKFKPYVVPNPYVGSASFEPQRFAVSGRGERRIEFRGLPRSCTIRIYTVHGDLVQTLHHDGSDDGYVAWDLRTKDNLDVAPGLYVYQVDGGKYGHSIGKFALIK